MPENDAKPDERPTPPAGMPSVMTPDSLRAIIREEIPRAMAPLEARVERIEQTATEQSTLLAEHTKLLRDQAQAITNVATAAARAADIGLEAKKTASEATQTASTIVESALRIHGASIAATVDEAVKSATRPLAANDAAQNKTLESQSNALAIVVRTLGVEDKVDPEITRSLPPRENAKKPEPAFEAIEKRIKSSSVYQIIVLVSMVAAAIAEGVRFVTGH